MARLGGLLRRWVREISRASARVTYRGQVDERRVPVVRRDPALSRWSGLWVAVKDGEVVAAAETSHALVKKVVELGPAARGAVAQFVPEPSDATVIGVG